MLGVEDKKPVDMENKYAGEGTAPTISAGGTTPTISAAADDGGCDGAKLLEQIEQQIAKLITSLPMDEFKKMTQFLLHEAAAAEAAAEPKKTIEPAPEGEQPCPDYTIRKKPNQLCFPFCDVTCKKPIKKNMRSTHNRAIVIQDLSKSISEGRKKAVRESMQQGDSGKKKPKFLKEMDGPTTYRTYKPCIRNKMFPKEENYDFDDGTRAFKDTMNVEQLKKIFPLLARVELSQGSKPIKAEELLGAIKEGKMPLAHFHLNTAIKICNIWNKAQEEERKIELDEAIFAIQKPKIYIKLNNEGRMDTLATAVENWVIKFAKLARRPTPPKLPRRSITANPPKLEGRTVNGKTFTAEDPHGSTLKHLMQISTMTNATNTENPSVSTIYQNAIKEFQTHECLQGKEDSPYAPNSMLPEMNKLTKDLQYYNRHLWTYRSFKPPVIANCYPQCDRKDVMKEKARQFLIDMAKSKKKKGKKGKAF